MKSSLFAADRAERPGSEATANALATLHVLDGPERPAGSVPLHGRHINVAEIVRYAQRAPELFEAAPRVKAWLAACHARPAFQKMWSAREAEPA